MGMGTQEPEPTIHPEESGDVNADGRTARRNRNLEAVLEAMVALIAEGQTVPTAAAVAVRSGVSQRSVNRYFGEVRKLQRAAVERELARGLPRYKLSAIGRGPRDRRIRDFVEMRIRAHEATGPVARAATVYSGTSKFIRNEFEVVRVMLRDQIARQFAPELDALPSHLGFSILLALDTLFQFASLDHYLVDLMLPPEETIERLVAAVTQLLAAVPDASGT